MVPPPARSPIRSLDLLTLDEVASISRHSRRTVHRWVSTGRLPTVKPSHRRLVRANDLAKLLGTDKD